MGPFGEIRSKNVLYAKGGLFLLLALLAAGLLIARTPRWDVAALLAICVWASCRSYYFAFYVIEHYVDPRFRFSGVINFLTYAANRFRHGDPKDHDRLGERND